MKHLSLGLFLLSTIAFADWKIVQSETRTLKGREQTSRTKVTTYVGSDRMRRDMEPEVGGQGLKAQIFFKGGDTVYFCTPTGKGQGNCSKMKVTEIFVPGQSFLSQMGASVKFEQLTVTPAGGKRDVGGKTCSPYHWNGVIAVSVPIIGNTFVKQKGKVCHADFLRTDAVFPKIMTTLQQASKSLMTPAAHKGFKTLAGLGLELERDMETTFASGFVGAQNSQETLKVVSIDSSKLDASLFELPKGYQVTEGMPGLQGIDLSKIQEMIKGQKPAPAPTKE